MNAQRLVRSLLVVLCLATVPAASYAGSWSVGISVGIPPPPLPVYVQPPCPAPGYIWTPGYWAYADDDQDYYWVPGTWVYAPSPGLLWTPGYWAEEDAAYAWHAGYWGPHVGFYGGVNYGFGYFGVGFEGGYWHGGDFYYNRAAANVENVQITNVYNNAAVVNNFNGERPSYNGPDGVHARPNRSELAALHEPHHGWTGEQQRHAADARAVPSLLASSNHGRPPIAATPRADVFRGNGVVAARPVLTAAAPSGRGSAAGGMRSPTAFAPSDASRYAGSGASFRERQTQTTATAPPERSDRPSWSSSGRTAPAPVPARWASSPPAHQTASWQSNTVARPYPPAGGTSRDVRRSDRQGRPAYSAATARSSPSPPTRTVQAPPNERARRPTPAPSAGAHAAPPTRQSESRPPPAYAAPSHRGETFRASSPPRAAPADQRAADQRHR